MVKPSSGAGSGLVRLVRDEAELAECVAASLAALATGRDYRHWANTGTPPRPLLQGLGSPSGLCCGWMMDFLAGWFRWVLFCQGFFLL